MSGRSERADSKAAKDRKPNLARAYRGPRWHGVPGAFEFEFTLLRGRGVPVIKLGPTAETIEWVDDQSALHGTMTLRRPVIDDPRSLPVGRGHQVRCRSRAIGGRAWSELWTMRVLAVAPDLTDGSLAIDLLDDLDMLRRNERDWWLRKSKGRPNGWGVHEAAVHVCRREGIPIGHLARGTARITKLRRRDATALDMLRAIYAKEREVSGRRFVIRWVKGKIEIREFEPNRVLLAFEDQLLSALLSRTGSARPFTVIVGRAHVGKGKGAKTVSHTEAHRDVVRRFGRAVSRRHYGRVDSEAELRRKVRRDYARALRVKKSASISAPGVPWIRRGMACELKLPAEGYSGDDAIVFTTSVTHRVDSSGYVMDVEVNHTDPFVRDQKRREAEVRAIKRRERRRRRQAAS